MQLLEIAPLQPLDKGLQLALSLVAMLVP